MKKITPISRAVCDRVLVVVWLLTVLPYNAAAADDEHYSFTVEPRRLALVLGNSVYEKLTSLPSAISDRKAMVRVLEDLHFSISETTTLTSARVFEEQELPKFLSIIRPGDIVLLYYTGHGFSSGAFSYLAPTAMSSAINQEDLVDQAIAVESLVDTLAARDPGLLVVVLDACRAVPGLELNNTDASALPKAPDLFSVPKETTQPVNVLVGLAAKHDTSAVGYADETKLSVFTKFLAQRLGSSSSSFVQLYMDLIDDVERATGSQSPGILVWSSTDFYLHPTPSVLADQKIAWESRLNSNQAVQIKSFTKRFATSLHAAAARKWLDDHPQDPLQFTQYSPIAIERAWSQENPIVFASNTGLGYPRIAKAAPGIDVLSSASLGVKTADGPKRTWQTEVEATVQQQATVALKEIPVREGPNGGGGKRIAIGTPLKITMLEKIGTKNAVIIAQTPDLDNVRIPLTAPGPALQVAALGKSLTEITLRPRTDAKDLLQLDELNTVMASLKSAKSTITWISVSAAATPDSEKKAEREALISHAIYALKLEGIDANRVSGVLNAADFADDGVRLRIFGY